MINRHANPGRRDEIHPFDYLMNLHRTFLTANLSKRNLRLRLVCRAFNSALLRLRFGTSSAGVVISAYGADTQNAVNRFITDDSKWDWSIAQETKRLRVELCPNNSDLGNSLFYEKYQAYDEVPPPYFEPERSVKQVRETTEMEQTAERLSNFLGADTLMIVVGKMTKLQALSVNLPQDWLNKQLHYPDPDNPLGVGHHWKKELNLRLDLLEKVRESVAGIFRCAPSNMSLANLTYLKLTLPCAYDFAVVEECLSDTVAHHLHHLYLEYIDGTGVGGNDEYLRDPALAPNSNLQRLYPNHQRTSALWKLVSRCTNLSSLGLAGTQRIEAPDSAWDGTLQLKNVYMQRVALHSEQLVEMMALDVEAVDFRDVKLVSGTWETVFDVLFASPRLVYVNVRNLAYAEDGECDLPTKLHNDPLLSSLTLPPLQDLRILHRSKALLPCHQNCPILLSLCF